MEHRYDDSDDLDFEDLCEIVTPEDLLAQEESDRERFRFSNRATTTFVGGKLKPVITVKANNLPEVLDQIDTFLVEMDAPIYQRCGALVRIGESSITKNKTGIEFVPIVAEDLQVILTRYITWIHYDARQKQDVNINCPLSVARNYAAQRGRWKLHTVHAIVTAPTLRADGSVLDRPGLDPRTGIYYDPRGVSFPQIPATPTKADARAALDKLAELVGEVPFVQDEDGRSVSLSVFLSGALTALMRPTLPAAPMHAFSAPTAGSGKSMLVAAIAILATGEPASVLAQGSTEEEMEKRLGTVLRAGDQVVSFDNCTRTLDGDLLCQAITEPFLTIRILGKSERVRVTNTALYMATGNNLVVVGDMVRRTLRSTIDADDERPENRTFDTERPDRLAARRRTEFVTAGLTVLKAFSIAGCPQPQGVAELGSLEEWSRTVRNALIWLGEADPCVSIEATRQEDPERVKVANVFRQWHEVCGSGPIRVEELIDRAYERRSLDTAMPGTNPPLVNPALLDALTAVCENAIGKLAKLHVGQWIGRNKNKIVDGYKILPATKVNGIARWRVIEVDTI